MKKKISKALAVILSILMLFTSFPAFALTEGTKYDFEEEHLNVYFKTGRWETADGDIHDNTGQVALRWLKDTGEPLYCIQPHKDCRGSDAAAEDITNTSIWKYELTSGQQSDIKLASIYGYPNFSYGYSWREAQLATSMLLYDIIIHSRTDFSVELTDFVKNGYYAYGADQQLLEDARACYLKIVEACANHSVRPNFGSTTIELKGAGESNAVTLTDKNGVLENFSVTSSNENVRVNKSGNTLKVWSRNSGDISAALVFTKYKTDINSAFALTGANQTLFYGTLADPVTTRLNVKMSTGMIKIMKASEDGILEGFHFTVNGPGFAAEIVTDKNGIATCEVPGNEYYVREKLIEGQERYDRPPMQDVIVKPGETVTIHFNNTVTKAKIALEKKGEIFTSVSYSEETQTYQPVYAETGLPNAVYDIYAAEDIISAGGTVLAAKDSVVDTVTTNENGEALSTELPLKTDGTAKYYVIEKEAPYGFVLDTARYDVELKKDGDTPVISTVSVSDTRQTVQVLFNKVLEADELFGIGNNGEIQNVVFGLYAAEELTAADGTVIPQDGLIETLKINPDNIFRIESDLPLGSYYFKEIATDTHYILSEETYPFIFEYTDPNTDIVTINLTEENAIENKLKRGKIEGLKTDDNGKALQGALIGLFKADETEFTEKTALLTATSDKDGKFSFENLPIGKYKIKELSSPKGYKLDETVYEADVTEDGSVVKLTIENKYIPIIPNVPKSPDTGNWEYNNDKAVIYAYISGAMFIIASGVILYFLTKKNKKVNTNK